MSPKQIAPDRTPVRQTPRGWGPLLFLLIVGAIAAVAWSGALPIRLAGIKPLQLDQDGAWFVDLRLAALGQSRPLCTATLASQAINASPIPDKPFVDGCGWRNGVRLSVAGGARLNVDRLTCEMAAATALWVQHAVQHAAETHLKARVATVQLMGGYSCRNIIGSKLWKDFRSQHATANAIDIAGFVLTDGRIISVKRHWTDRGAEGQFLRAVHRGACRYYRVVLGPDYNAAHHDHFHFDRGYLKSCR